MLFLAPETVASLSIQWGNTLWPMLVDLGPRARHHLPAEAASTSARPTWFRSSRCALVRSARHRPRRSLAEVAPITGPMYQLFIFFMITDPKTTVHSPRGSASSRSW